jgi:hypothetical protein
MSDAGIDVALPVYWGTTEQWSTDGLVNLARAKADMTAAGEKSPDIGLFFDTTILSGKDLTKADGQDYFYSNIREFYRRIPREQWALIDGRPIIWLFIAHFPKAFNQSTFNYIYDHFQADFGVRPYIVREVNWDYTVLEHTGDTLRFDYSRPIATEASYVWGAAADGVSPRGTVAAVGPGYDERQIKGRPGTYRPRDNGKWYTDNFAKATASHRRMLVIETWNEFHEASAIADTVEFGRTYIDLTRKLVQQYKQSFAQSPP